jgi:exonuclease III
MSKIERRTGDDINRTGCTGQVNVIQVAMHDTHMSKPYLQQEKPDVLVLQETKGINCSVITSR